MGCRVLLVDFITTFGGVQRVMVNMIPELSRYVEAMYIDALREPTSRKVFMSAGIPLVDLALWPRRSALGFEGSAAHKLGVLALWGPAYSLYAVRLACHARRRGFQVLYTNSKKGLVVTTAVSLLAGRLPVIYHCHGVDGPQDVDPVYRAAIKACRAVIVVSHDVREKLVKAGVPDTLVHVVYNGVDRRQLELAAAQSSETKAISANPAPKCLVACNLQDAKGVHIAIEAVRLLRSRGRIVHLYVAGDIPRGGDTRYRAFLEQTVRESGLEGQVHFLGWRDDLAAVMKACDLLLVPSLAGWGESFGMVAVEAMALGEPVVASRIGGLPEVVYDGRTGLLFQPGDASQLAEEISILVSDRALYRSFAEEARRWVDEHFTVERQARAIAQIIHDVIGRGE